MSKLIKPCRKCMHPASHVSEGIGHHTIEHYNRRLGPSEQCRQCRCNKAE